MGKYRVPHEAQEKIRQDSIAEAVSPRILVLQHHVVNFQKSAAHQSIETLCFVDFSRDYGLGQSSIPPGARRGYSVTFVQVGHPLD